MKIALVGGAGFIGSHLCRALLARGHDLCVVDSLMVNNVHAKLDLTDRQRLILAKRRAVLANTRFVQADARDYEIMSEVLGSFAPEVVVHLAAVAHQDRAQRSPHTTWGHSLRTLENALDIAGHLQARRFVYFSSSTVYGEWPASGTVREDSVCLPIHVYGSLKLAGEYAARSICNAHGIEHVVIRPSALYGPGCISGRVIQRFIENAIDGQPLHIRADDWLDFTHVNDLVHGVTLAIEKKEAANRTYNLTRGVARSIREAAEIVNRHVPTDIHALNTLDGFPKRGALDVSRATAELGYSPQYDIERGIADYIEWYRALSPSLQPA